MLLPARLWPQSVSIMISKDILTNATITNVEILKEQNSWNLKSAKSQSQKIKIPNTTSWIPPNCKSHRKKRGCHTQDCISESQSAPQFMGGFVTKTYLRERSQFNCSPRPRAGEAAGSCSVSLRTRCWQRRWNRAMQTTYWHDADVRQFLCLIILLQPEIWLMVHLFLALLEPDLLFSLDEDLQKDGWVALFFSSLYPNSNDWPPSRHSNECLIRGVKLFLQIYSECIKSSVLEEKGGAPHYHVMICYAIYFILASLPVLEV